MPRPHTLVVSLTLTLWAFVVPAGAKPQVRRDDETLAVLNNNQGKSPCELAWTMRSLCDTEADSDVTPTKCSCNNVFFNIWSACTLSNGSLPLPSFSEWGSECKNASQNITDGYVNGLDLDIPIWAFMRVPDGDKFNVSYVRTALRNNFAIDSTATQKHWSTIQKIAPVISSVATLVLVGIIVILYRSHSAKETAWSIPVRSWFFRAPRKVRKAPRSETWSIDQSENTNEFVMVDIDDARSHRVQSPELLSQAEDDRSLLPPPKAPWQTLWRRPMQLPSRFPIPWGDRPIPVQSGPPTRRFHINSVDHSTLSGISGGSMEGGYRNSTVKFSSLENNTGGSSRAHETIEEVSDEDEDTSLISPVARSENHVFLISNRERFTIGSGTSQSGSGHVHIQPPTPTVSSHYSPVIAKQILKPRMLARVPPPPKQPAPSPPVVPPRIPPQLQIPRSEAQSQQPVASTSRLTDTHVPLISQPPLSISPPRPPGPLQFNQPRQQFSLEEDDPLHQRKLNPPRKPIGGRQFLTSPSSKESLRHENAFSNVQYSAQAHQRQLSDSAARRSPLHWRDEVYQGGTSPPLIHRELSIEEEISRPVPSHHPGIAGPSSQLPRSPAPIPIPHRRGHSADDATSSTPSVFQPSPYSHARNLSSENVVPPRSDPVNLFPGAVRATGYPNSQAATESSVSLYSDGSYPTQAPNAAYPHHRS